MRRLSFLAALGTACCALLAPRCALGQLTPQPQGTALLGAAPPVAVQPATAPPLSATLRPAEGVLLLRNGSLIRGRITPAGAQYVVTLGETSEIRLPTSEVEAWCEDLADAYRWKATHLPAEHADAHLGLAEWCLRQHLFDEAAAHQQVAAHREPNNPRVAAFADRLTAARQLAAAPPSTTAPRSASPAAAHHAPGAASATSSRSEIEESLRNLPQPILERFASTVQPLLLNRCANGACHGAGAKNPLALIRTSGGQPLPQRFSQRNLHAVLRYVNRERPEESPLLRVPQERHGDTLGPIWDERSKRQAETVLAWLRLFATRPAGGDPLPTTAPRRDSLTQPAPLPAAASATPGAITQASALSATAPQVPRAAPAASQSVPGGDYQPRDPFDPELFNRRFGVPQSQP